MKAIPVIFLLMFSLTAFSNEQTDRKLAIEYIESARIQQSIGASLEAYSRHLFSKLPTRDREKAAASMQKTMGWDAVKEQLVDLVLGTYTADELKAAIAFMHTPLGAAYTAKSKDFHDKWATLISQNFQRVLREHPIPPN